VYKRPFYQTFESNCFSLNLHTLHYSIWLMAVYCPLCRWLVTTWWTLTLLHTRCTRWSCWMCLRCSAMLRHITLLTAATGHH